MIADPIDALLADLLGAPEKVTPALHAAKATNPAKGEHPCGFSRDPGPCEDLRKPANDIQVQHGSDADSQAFAAVRKPSDTLQSKHPCGSSQDSQDSQPTGATTTSAADLAAVAWTDADIAQFIDRRARLLRWGWNEAEAERLAERLAKRDRDLEDRVSCTDCTHYRPGRCGNHRRAGLQTAEVGRNLAGLLQRCPGFQVEG